LFAPAAAPFDLFAPAAAPFNLFAPAAAPFNLLLDRLDGEFENFNFTSRSYKKAGVPLGSNP
jgi:hypothetical protein